MAKQAFPITTYSKATKPVANGYLRIRLNTDGSVSGSQIASNFTVVQLDDNGVITNSPMFWPNDVISPSGTYYILEVFTQEGQLIGGPTVVNITTPYGFGEAFGIKFGS